MVDQRGKNSGGTFKEKSVGYHLTREKVVATWMKIVATEQIDGFFLPYDLIASVPTFWPDGAPVCLYRSSRGFLVLRPGLFARFGNKNDEQFSQSVLLSQVFAHRPADIILLGPTRRIKGCPWHLRLMLKGEMWSFEFLAADELEAVSIQAVLARLFVDVPHRIIVSRSPIWECPNFFNHRKLIYSLGQISSSQRKAWLGLFFIALIGVGLVIFSVIGILGVYSEYIALAWVLSSLWRFRRVEVEKRSIEKIIIPDR